MTMFFLTIIGMVLCHHQLTAAPTETGNSKTAADATPGNANVATAIKVLPSLDAKQIVVGLIEREDFEGSVADEAARARSATREARKIVVPPEITITSGSLNVFGELLPGRKGRIIEVGSDGIPVVHGVREADDTNEPVWRNAVVYEGKLIPGASLKNGRSLELDSNEEFPPATKIQPRILTGGDVHVVEAVPIEERHDTNGPSVEAKQDNEASSSNSNPEYASSSQYSNNHRFQTQSHQVQPVYSSNDKPAPKGVGSVEPVDLEPGYASSKREFSQTPKKKKNRKQQQQQKLQQQQQSVNRDDSALDQEDGFNPSQYFNNFQQQAGAINGFETNYLHSAGGANGVQEDGGLEYQSDPNVHPEAQFQFTKSKPQRQQQRPVQVQQGPAPQPGQVLPNGGVVVGPADPNDFVVQHYSYDNGFSIPIPVPVGQLAGVKTEFVYEDPTAEAISEELFGQEPQQPQRPFPGRPGRRPGGRDQSGPVRRPPFYPPQGGRPGQQQFLHSHARPGRPGAPQLQQSEDEGTFNRMRQNLRQSMRRRYQQFQEFVNPVVGPLRQASKQISHNLGISESLDSLNERLSTVVGAPGLPLILGGALTVGAIGLGAHALNNFEISVNRGGRRPDGEKSAKTAATAAVVTDAIEAATKAYSEPSSTTTSTTEKTSETPTTTAKSAELKSGRQAKVLKLEDMQLRRRKRSALARPEDDPDFLSNDLEVFESPDAVYYAKVVGDDYSTRKRSPCVGKIGCRVTSVIYPSIERDHEESDEIVPSRAPRDVSAQYLH